MREIRFRAWDKVREEMFGVSALTYSRVYDSFYNNGPGKYAPRDETELMQYTGFKDKASVEIYEGDIINAHWFYPKLDPETLGMSEGEINLSRLEVMEMRGMLGFYFEDEFMPLGFVPAHEESFEVIGNIYENPELLEVD